MREGLLRTVLAGVSYMVGLELVAALLDVTLEPELLAGPVLLWCYLLLSPVFLGWYVTSHPRGS